MRVLLGWKMYFLSNVAILGDYVEFHGLFRNQPSIFGSYIFWRPQKSPPLTTNSFVATNPPMPPAQEIRSSDEGVLVIICHHCLQDFPKASWGLICYCQRGATGGSSPGLHKFFVVRKLHENQLFTPFGRETTPIRALTNHGCRPFPKLDDPLPQIPEFLACRLSNMALDMFFIQRKTQVGRLYHTDGVLQLVSDVILYLGYEVEFF